MTITTITTEAPTAALDNLHLRGGDAGRPAPLVPSGALDQFNPRELTPTLGTLIDSGVQLAELLEHENADELFKELAITIHRRNVVFFKNQHEQLTNDQLKRIASKLGKVGGGGSLHIHPTERYEGRKEGEGEGGEKEDDNEISPISSVALGKGRRATAGSRLASRGWHTDITFEPVPSDIAILNVWEAPDVGGDTVWASAYEAYDRLSPPLAAFLEGLTAEHSGTQFHQVAAARGIKLYDGERGHPDNKGTELTAVHPVITVNSVTGWKGLFVNPVFTKRILGLTIDESDSLLAYLFSLFTLNHDLQVRFSWSPNDLALWSNTSSLHNVTLDYTGTKRTGHRAVSLGPRPWFEEGLGKSRREDLGLPKWSEE